jgi:hypothetical protein
MLDKDGEIRSMQRLDENGLPAASYTDSAGRVRLVQRLAPDGNAQLEFYEANGQVVWTARIPQPQ